MSQINLKRNILMSGSFRIVIMFVTFVTSIFSARYLGVELKGKLSYLVTLSGFVWLVFDMGLYRSYPYLVRKFPDKIGCLFSWSFIQFIIESAVLFVLGLSLLHIWNSLLGFALSPLYMVLFVCLITFPQLIMQLQSLYLGLNKIWNYSLAQVLNSILMLFLICLGYLFIHKTDRLAYVMISSVNSVIVCIIYYIANHKWSEQVLKVDFKFIISSYKSGIRVFLSTLCIVLLIRFDIIIIKHLLDFKQVGIYSLAAQIIDMLQIASNVVGGLLLVKLSDCPDDVTKWNIMKKILMVFFVMLGFANLGFLILGKFLITTLYGIQFVPVFDVFLWLIPASFGLSFGSLFNMYLNSKGFPVISIILPAIALVCNIGLNFILIPFFGIRGSALATSLSYLLWFFMLLIYEQKYSKGQMFKHLIPGAKDWLLLWQESIKLGKDSLSRLHISRDK